MSETTIPSPARDKATGRFQPGNNGGLGRPPGSRNKLAEAFLQDLAVVWEERGIEALRRCAEEEPAQFCRVVASLMPKDININAEVSHLVDPAAFASKFRAAMALLDNEPPPPLKVINGR